MKKIFNYSILLLCTLMLGLVGCKNEPLVFDHELPQFKLVDNAILLEVIVPTSTAPDEQIYIVSEAFADGKKFLCEKAAKSDKKWGVYLYKEDFAEGKSLKDGFTFESKKNGAERSVKNEPVKHTLDVALGTRTNVWIDRWASYFQNNDTPDIVPGEYEHLYVTGNIDGSSWDPAKPIELEMVGTDIFRGEITFTEATSYFAIATEMGDWDTFNAARWGANDALLTEGSVLDLVPQSGSDQCVTIAAGTYTITINMAVKQIVIGEGDWTKPEQPGKYEHLYVLGNIEGTGWTPAEPIEMEKVGRDLFRAELTFVPDGTNTICYFAFATEKGANNDDWATLNAARWGGGELTEGVYVPLTLQTNSDMTVTIAPGTYTITVNMIFKEAVIGEGDWSTREEPKDEDDDKGDDTPIVIVPDTVTTHLYFIDETADMHYIYTYGGDVNLFGAWPGADWTAWQTATFFGQKLYCYEFDQVEGLPITGIVNNNNGTQIEPAFQFVVGDQTEYFFSIGDKEVTEVRPTPDKAEKIRRLFRK